MMKIALLADVHANFHALEQVWGDFQKQAVEAVWFLGDIVDRGPDPIETLAWLRDEIHAGQQHAWVMGNHDAMMVNLLTEEQWGRVNDVHRQDNGFHRKLLQRDPRAWGFIQREFTPARLLPQMTTLEGVEYILVHGGMVDHAGYYRYLYPWWEPPLFHQEECERLNRAAVPRVMVCGHTHVSMLVCGMASAANGCEIEATRVLPGQTYLLDPAKCWLINPGSVGQPRDLDNRAAYAVLDTLAHTVTFHRLEYDWRSAVRKLIDNDHHPMYPDILQFATPDRDTPEAWLAHYRLAREAGR